MISRSPEFAGIHLLYLRSKVIALRAVALVLFLAGIFILISAITSYNRIIHLTNQMEEFAHISCPEGAISLIIERDRAICVMRRAAPGDLTHAVPPGWLAIPRGRKEKN